VLEKIDENTLLLIVSDHGFTSFERAVNLNTWLVENEFMVLSKKVSGEDSGLFRGVDFTKTKAYAVGFNSLYLNLKDREGKGIVEDPESVISELIEKLEALTDNNQKVINKVYRKEDIYSGEELENAPDLIVGFNPGYRMSWETATGGLGERVIEQNKKRWTGDHLIDPKFVPGVLFSNIKLNSNKAHQLDIAPTILTTLGIEGTPGLDGRNLID